MHAARRTPPTAPEAADGTSLRRSSVGSTSVQKGGSFFLVVLPTALPRERGLEHRDRRLRDAAGRAAALGAAALTLTATASTGAERADAKRPLTPRSWPTWQGSSRCATFAATHSGPATDCPLDAFPSAFFFERRRLQGLHLGGPGGPDARVTHENFDGPCCAGGAAPILSAGPGPGGRLGSWRFRPLDVSAAASVLRDVASGRATRSVMR